MVELNIITDLYDEDKEGNQILIKSNMVYKHMIDADDITSISEIPTSKGVVYKNRCLVNVRDIGSLIVKDKYTNVIKLKGRMEVKGFKK